jgi:hypothetical protein
LFCHHNLGFPHRPNHCASGNQPHNKPAFALTLWLPRSSASHPPQSCAQLLVWVRLNPGLPRCQVQGSLGYPGCSCHCSAASSTHRCTVNSGMKTPSTAQDCDHTTCMYELLDLPKPHQLQHTACLPHERVDGVCCARTTLTKGVHNACMYANT